MTAPQTPDREQEIRARAEAATRCPEAVVNGRLDGEHTWVGGSFTSVRCELCGFSRTRGERAEDTMELLAEIDRLRAGREAAVAAAVRRALEDFASRLTARAASMGATHFRVDQVADAARRIAAEEHGPSVASPAREQGEADRVVAYRNSERPSVLLCREHGDGWVGLTPLTAEDLPDGGICTWGRPDGPECGRDVLITPASEQGGDAR